MRVCVRCRLANYFPVCQSCGVTTWMAPRNWRPPRKTNDLAWKRVAKGDWLWDHNAVASKATRRAEAMDRLIDALKRRAALRRRG